MLRPKYDVTNVGETLAKMRKMHPELSEYKKTEDKRVRRFFFDSSQLCFIPEEIREEAKNKLVEGLFKNCYVAQSSIDVITISGTDCEYEITVEYRNYIVRNAKGERIYSITEIAALRLRAFAYNGYGVVPYNASAEYVREYGQFSSTSYSIVDIDF